jgi:hypothetical protein
MGSRGWAILQYVVSRKRFGARHLVLDRGIKNVATIVARPGDIPKLCNINAANALSADAGCFDAACKAIVTPPIGCTPIPAPSKLMPDGREFQSTSPARAMTLYRKENAPRLKEVVIDARQQQTDELIKVSLGITRRQTWCTM